MAASIGSVLKIDAESVADVYGDLRHLKTGLRQLDQQLSEPGRVDRELARYASMLIFLEGPVMENPDMVNGIAAAIRQADFRARGVGDVLDDEVLSALSDGYQRTLSTINPRVVISGEQRHLSDVRTAQRIRALLLAGLRAVVLWRQCGGVRWKLLFTRGSLQREVRALLETL